MKLKLKIEIEANSPKAFRQWVNEAIRRLALANEYEIGNGSQTTTENGNTFTIEQSTEVIPNDSKGGEE